MRGRYRHPSQPGQRIPLVLVIECACGHSEELTAAMLTTAGVVPYHLLG